MLNLKNVGLLEHICNPFVMPFSCFSSKKASLGGFSFDSYSANDE